MLHYSIKYTISLVSLLLLAQLPAIAGEHELDHGCENTLKAVTVIKGGSFKDNRGLNSYLSMLGPEFMYVVSKLSSQKKWLDAGAGTGLATYQYLTTENSSADWWNQPLKKASPGMKTRDAMAKITKKTPAARAQVIAVSKDTFPRDAKAYAAANPEKYTLLDGAFFEEIAPEKLPEPASIDLISDVYGVLAYSPRIDAVLGRYMDLVSESGNIFIYGGDTVTTEKIFQLWIERDLVLTKTGKQLSVLNWIKRIPGIKHSTFDYFEIDKFERHYVSVLRLRRDPKTELSIPKVRLKSIEVRSPSGIPLRPPFRIFEEI